MNEKALHVLEFDKIIDRLTQLAGSKPGKKLCQDLVPLDDLSAIIQMQTETSDALARIFRSGTLSFSGVVDLRGELKRLEIGSSMNAIELLQVQKLLTACKRAKAFAHAERSSDELHDSLSAMFDALEPLSDLAREIDRCLPSAEEVADDASPHLRQIRRNMDLTHERIRSQLSGMLNGSARTYLQEAVITQRNGRFCLPVKAEYRGQVQGMIHDQSSSGSTLFIEPMAVVKLNNDLRELELEEIKEIEAILARLSGQVAEVSGLIIEDIELLTKLDFIFARAMLSRSYRGFAPDFNDEGIVDIRKGRHPLLDPHKVVPIDIRIGKDFDLLVISGPNTGGKTVSLKTIGLFTLMGQAGLHIPAAEHSQLALFTEVFADIGDEQSIEQSLSTFSSHMTNIVSFWEKANEHSLVLFDELGAGTDPTEGAALAIALLSDLHMRGARCVATTHYSELKIYALSTDGVENACCEFDVESLRPTYRLLIGVPGKSNAFAISSKLGLPDYIIEAAKGHISEEAENFEDVVADLENTRKEVEAERQKAAQYRAEMEKLRDELAQKQSRLDERKDKILASAREQAQEILRETKEYADETIRKYNKLGSEKEASRAMERERAALREKMDKLDKARASAKKKPAKAVEARALHIGDSVKVLSLGLKGTVSTLPDAKGNLFVQMGILRSQVKLNDIELLEEETIKAPSYSSSKKGSGQSRIKMSKSASATTEINLLGKTTDEAIMELDKYLDDAYLAHLPSVRIVHGKGTGALRKAVHQYLRRQKHVAEYRLGEFGEGDSGVTIATFK